MKKLLDEILVCKRLNADLITFDGGRGIIHMPTWSGSIVWSYGGGWDHVSVAPFKKRITPSWDDMCMIKDIFFYEHETVVQYHPAKSEYVNNMPNCLHLWRPNKEKMLIPPSVMTGVRDGQSIESVKSELKELETQLAEEFDLKR